MHSELQTFPALSSAASKKLQKAVALKDVSDFASAFADTFEKPAKRFEKLTGDIPLLSAYGWDGFGESSEEFAARVNAVRDAKKSGARKKALAALIEYVTCQFEESPRSRVRALLVTAELLLRYPAMFDRDVLVQTLDRFCRFSPVELQAELGNSDVGVWPTLVRLELTFVLQQLLQPFENQIEGDSWPEQFGTLVDEISDTDGVPRADVISELHLWVGFFTRVSVWSKSLKAGWLTEEGSLQWGLLSACLVGHLATFDWNGMRAESHALPEIMLSLAGHSATSNSRQLSRAMATGKDQKPARGSKSRKLARGNHQSDWAANALMRNGWSSNSDALSLQWNDVEHQLSLIAGGREILRGPWATKCSIDGNAIAPHNDWECTCWFEDDDVAFVELEADCADGIKCVRQVLLSMSDQFALFLDSVVADRDDATVELDATLNYSPAASPMMSSITRDWQLNTDGISLRAIPIWLPDDRLHSGPGRFNVSNGRVSMTAFGCGAVTMPLIVDWGQDRAVHDADWTALTITEERRVVSQREAAAFRVRIFQLQLLIYRSLIVPESLRAVLGQHTDRETLIGKISTSGQVAPLVIVDGEAD